MEQWNANRKLYAVYGIVTYPIILSNPKLSKYVSLDIHTRQQSHEDVSMAPGGPEQVRREQVRIECLLEGAL